MVQNWRKVTDTKTGTLWFNDETQMSVFTVMEKLKNRFVWSVKKIKGTGKARKLKSFTNRPAANRFAMKYMKAHMVPGQAAKKAAKGAVGVLRKLGKVAKKVAAEQRTPEAVAKRAKRREQSFQMFTGRESKGALGFGPATKGKKKEDEFKVGLR